MMKLVRRLTISGALVALVATGCASTDGESAEPTTSASLPSASSSDSGSGTTETTEGDRTGSTSVSGDYDDACALIDELSGLDDFTESDDLDPFLDLLSDLEDAGPPDLADSVATFSEALQELASLPDEDSAEAFDILLDPEFDAAATDIEDFASEECDIDLGGDEGDTGTGGEDGTGSTDDDATSIDGVKAYLEGRFPDEPGVLAVVDATSWSAAGGSSSKSWTIILRDDPEVAALPVADLEAACEAMASYLDPYLDTEITIQGADDVTLVTREPGEACVAA